MPVVRTNGQKQTTACHARSQRRSIDRRHRQFVCIAIVVSSLVTTAGTFSSPQMLPRRGSSSHSGPLASPSGMEWNAVMTPRRFVRYGADGQMKYQKTSRSTVSRAALDASTTDTLISIVGWSVVFASLGIIGVAVSADESDTPRQFLARPAGNPDVHESNPSRVVCVGDSLTRGNLSADWVGALRDHLGEGLNTPTTVLNAGVNMQCAQNILRRLDEVIACRPSHVTVLVGTNDLKAELSPIEAFMYKTFGSVTQAPTVENYAVDLIEIRDRLLATGARVALVSPPVLGEDRNSQANQRCAEYAEVVRRTANSGGERCTYLPLFEKTAAALPAGSGKPYCGLQFFSWLCLLCLDIHVRGRCLKDVQRERDLGVTVDLVHLGPAAAEQLVEMVADFVTTASPALPMTSGFPRSVTM